MRGNFIVSVRGVDAIALSVLTHFSRAIHHQTIRLPGNPPLDDPLPGSPPQTIHSLAIHFRTIYHRTVHRQTIRIRWDLCHNRWMRSLYRLFQVVILPGLIHRPHLQNIIVPLRRARTGFPNRLLGPALGVSASVRCCQVNTLLTNSSNSDLIQSFDFNWLSFIVSPEPLFLYA